MSRYDLDVRNLHKIPAPPKPRWFDEELSRLMPRNPFGETYLKMQWGMDAVQFRNGNPHAPLEIAAHDVAIKRIFRRLDPVEGKFEYFRTRDDAVESLNIRLSPTIDHKDYKTVTLFGPPRWMLTGWLSPEKLGTPEQWAANRYATVTIRGGKKVRLDCNGPYPSRGRYVHIWTVAGPNGEFRDLDRGVIAECERRVAEHKQAVAQRNDHTDAQELRDDLARRQAAEELEEQQTAQDFTDYVGPSKYRLIEGNAFSGYRGTAASQAGSNKPKRSFLERLRNS